MIRAFAVLALIAVTTSLARRVWWLESFTPGEVVNLATIAPWRWRPFRRLLRPMARYWHHKLMRRHVADLTMVGNTFGGIRQKRDFWVCWCGFSYSWAPEGDS